MATVCGSRHRFGRFWLRHNNVHSDRLLVPYSTTNAYAKFKGRSKRALGTIVLTVDPTLLYLLKEPDDLVTVRKKTFWAVSKENMGKQACSEMQAVLSTT